MKKSSVKKTFIFAGALLLSLAFYSCASNRELTENLSLASAVANIIGLDQSGAVLGAAASASHAMEDITPENEYYIGRAVAATILTNYKLYENKTEENYLNKICAVLAENTDGPAPFNGYHVKLLDTDEKNAFATSGGHIFVTRGLVSCAESEDALAAILAHEMSHVQLKHSLKSIKASRWTQAGFDLTNAAITSVQYELKNDQLLGKDKLLDSSKVMELAKSMSGMVEDVVANMVNNGYSKGQEFDADALAVKILASAGYTPSSMLSMLESLKVGQGSSKKGMYKTHPSPADRIKSVNSELKKIKTSEDTSSFREERFKSLSQKF